MSDIIQLLPDSVANQIAAGEVIQRPASVIKELVENAVDAGATTINVIVVDAGRTSIQVIDNGKGMSMTDARLAFERHATSKIRKADDLFALNTMGFRGEALPSIAAVAMVELRSRTADSDIGTHISISGSSVTAQVPESCPVGSNFKVENLFYNVPARRKFLKTNATELNNIIVAFQRIALVYPHIHFTFHSNESELFDLRSGSLRQRIVDIFGKKLNSDLLPLDVTTTMCKVTGFIGKPESAKKKGAHEYFFVNGRYMKHPYFHKAVMQAYDRLVPAGMSVPYFIYFEVNPADIDVNIHPTKTEIKFENEQPIWQIILAAVKDAIGKFCDLATIDFDTVGQPDIPVFNPAESIAQPETTLHPTYNPFKTTREPSSYTPRTNMDDSWEELYKGLGDSTAKDGQQPTLFDDAAPADEGGTILEMPLSHDAEETQNVIDEKSPAHYQYKGRYIMTAVKSGLMIIDQHRADMRVRYERYLAMIANRKNATQRLLFAEMMQFDTAVMPIVERLMPELAAIGFELTPLGGGSYALNGIPAGIENMNPAALLQQIVDDAADMTGSTIDDINSSMAMSMARSAAITYGEILTNDEMENLVNELFACENVNYTPDGHPVFAIMQQKSIEQLLD